MKTRTIILGVGISLGVIGAALLVAFGLTYTRPYVRVSGYREARCMVTSSQLLEVMVRCKCTSCTSRYPCSRVEVTVARDTSSLTRHHTHTDVTDDVTDEVTAHSSRSTSGIIHTNATLYDTYETYQLQHHVKQCSHHTCHRSQKKNAESVVAFLDRYGNVNSTFACYYNPESHEPSVIITIVQTSTVICAMLFPTLAIIVGVAILIYYLSTNSADDNDSSRKGAKDYLESFRARVGSRYEHRYDNESAKSVLYGGDDGRHSGGTNNAAGKSYT